MYRTIVCKKCDYNKVIIEKIGPQLYVKCPRCGNDIMHALHMESWNKNIDNTYKFRISIDDDRLFEADIIESENDKKERKILNKEQTKIRLMYVKEYEYIRQLEEDEYMEIAR